MLDSEALAARQAAARQHWLGLRTEARADPNRLLELCFRNDQADSADTPFAQQWFHREWQDVWRRERISVIHGATGFGKTEQLIGHLLWRMGNKPTIRIAIVGKQVGNAEDRLAKIKRQIDTNPMLRAIFPELRAGEPWSTEKLRLAGAGVDTTTNTVQCYGVGGSPQGLRGDIIVLDDVIDFENTLSEYQRKQVIDWCDAVIQTRLTTRGQLIILANAWHPEDLAFTYAKRSGIWHKSYPAENLATGELLWPSFRSRDWINTTKASTTPTQYARMYLCQPRDESTRIFKGEWLATARRLGAGLLPLRSVKHRFGREGQLLDPSAMVLLSQAAAQEMHVVVGVDLASGETEKKRKTDFTVLFVLGIQNGLRQVLWIERGRWSLDEIIARLQQIERRYRPERYLLESNGMQKSIVSFVGQMPDFGGRIEPFVTSGEKWDETLGIQGIGLELKAGRWLIPSPAAGETESAYLARLEPEQREAYANINAWAQHLLDFSRGPHTPDDVMASYFAQRGALRLGLGIFENNHAAEMAVPTLEHVAAQQAGTWATVSALYPPLPADDAAEVPAEIRRLYGL